MKLSQDEFAARIGLAPRTYQYLEQGKGTKIGLDTLVELAKTGVSMSWLISGTSEIPKGTAGFWGANTIRQAFWGGPPDGHDKRYFPLMWDGTQQRSLALTVETLSEKGQKTDSDSWRLFPVESAGTLMPHWGITAGDLVLVDSGVNDWQGEGVYVVELEPGGDPQLRAVIRRGGSLWMEHSPATMDHQPFLEPARILGRAVWRAGVLG